MVTSPQALRAGPPSAPIPKHVGVLFSDKTMQEALSWLDQTFGVERQEMPQTKGAGHMDLRFSVECCFSLGRSHRCYRASVHPPWAQV